MVLLGGLDAGQPTTDSHDMIHSTRPIVVDGGERRGRTWLMLSLDSWRERNRILPACAGWAAGSLKITDAAMIAGRVPSLGVFFLVPFRSPNGSAEVMPIPKGFQDGTHATAKVIKWPTPP